MDAITHNSAVADVFTELWTPDMPLPTLGLLRRIIERICELWGETDLAHHVKPVYNTRLTTTLGRAAYREKRVELNPRLLAVHPGELIPTLAHELAHLVVYERYGMTPNPHGPEFKAVMRSLNFSSRATHKLPVSHLRKKRASKYVYLHRCSRCGYKFVSRTAKRNYYCLDCGPDMTWDIYRLPNSPAGKRLLEHLKQI